MSASAGQPMEIALFKSVPWSFAPRTLHPEIGAIMLAPRVDFRQFCPAALNHTRIGHLEIAPVGPHAQSNCRIFSRS
jgi:hypothetical protein